MTHRLKSTVTLVILISVLSLYLFQPSSANAQAGATSVTNDIIGALPCSVAGVLAPWLVGQINSHLRKLGEDLFWNSTNRYFQAFGRLLLKNTSVPINDKANDTRITILDVFARCVARELMNDLTARITGAVRTSGRDSRAGRLQPSFVRDWRRFLTNA